MAPAWPGLRESASARMPSQSATRLRQVCRGKAKIVTIGVLCGGFTKDKLRPGRMRRDIYRPSRAARLL
jgi:hypothetical protein